MSTALTTQEKAQAAEPVPRPACGLLQRKCACGQHNIAGSECEQCEKKRLQRRAAGRADVEEAPPIVHEVLSSSGQPLDPRTRSLMEPGFGYDFSHVRVHTDTKAAESARSVNAMAYTVGNDVAFGRGLYEPGTLAGLHLLAHELSHVVQQDGSKGSPARSGLEISAPASASEEEADSAANRVVAGLPASLQRAKGPPALMRRLMVNAPAAMIPNPQGNGLVQTNAATVEQYLRALSPAGNPRVNPSTGLVEMDPEFCRGRGFFGRVGRGIAHGFMTGARIGAYFLGVGAIPGAILGGLIGGIAGIFGPNSQAEESSTPTGSTCICDFINSRNDWRIQIDDSDTPLTGTGLVRINSPNSPHLYGAATRTGRLENMEPWVVLGHELCGHAWLEEHNRDEGDVQSEDLRHHRSVERENLIRAEHGLPERGYRLKDPYCGESFYRERSDPQGAVHWQRMYDERNRQAFRGTPLEPRMNDTYLDECQRMREQELGALAHRYRVDERIP